MSQGRRQLRVIDDPLNVASPPAALPPAAPVPDERDRALYVRLPAREFDALARAAFELRVSKRELVAALIREHVDPLTADGLAAIAELVGDDRDSPPAP